MLLRDGMFEKKLYGERIVRYHAFGLSEVKTAHFTAIRDENYISTLRSDVVAHPIKKLVGLVDGTFQ